MIEEYKSCCPNGEVFLIIFYNLLSYCWLNITCKTSHHSWCPASEGMDPGCCLKSVIFIWSVEQGLPGPDSSPTKIISYIPFPQVGPVSLDAEDKVNQVKDVVMLLGLIRLSEWPGSIVWPPPPPLTTGRLLRTSAAPSIRSDQRNIQLSVSQSDHQCLLSASFTCTAWTLWTLANWTAFLRSNEPTSWTGVSTELVTMWLLWNSSQDMSSHKYGPMMR